MVKSLSQRTRGPNFGKGSILFLARPRELRGRMFKGSVLIGSPHLTKRAPDAGESARFSGVFSASAFFSFGRRAAARPSAGNANRWVADVRNRGSFIHHSRFRESVKFLKGNVSL